MERTKQSTTVPLFTSNSNIGVTLSDYPNPSEFLDLFFE